jgi:hypothetical protein
MTTPKASGGICFSLSPFYLAWTKLPEPDIPEGSLMLGSLFVHPSIISGRILFCAVNRPENCRNCKLLVLAVTSYFTPDSTF